ncbi:MAG: hypothetical protein P4M13_03975 [Alphaproteobacteria bacterium]|nr:hypothetical protein [Alphaproteobacteria bacterium]
MPNPHSRKIMKEEFLNGIGLSQNKLGHRLGDPANRIHVIVNGAHDKRAIAAKIIPWQKPARGKEGKTA